MQDCRILTNNEQLAALQAEWIDLSNRLAPSCFCDPRMIDVWMRTAGAAENTSYHIVTLHRQGRLTGVLPLVVTRKKGLRLLRWAGHDVFWGALHLFETEDDRAALWRAALDSTAYDVAKIKYLYPETVERALVASRAGAFIAEMNRVTDILFQGRSGPEWLASLSQGTRRDYNRKRGALEKLGPVQFRVSTGQALPYDEIARMMNHKRDWAAAKNEQSTLFDCAELVPEMIRQAGREGTACIHELRCGEQTVALSINFIHKKTLFWYITTRDPAGEKVSVGALSLVQTALWAAENGFERVHLMEGPNAYKTRYCTTDGSFDVFFWGRGLRGRLAALLYKAAHLVKNRGKLSCPYR